VLAGCFPLLPVEKYILQSSQRGRTEDAVCRHAESLDAAYCVAFRHDLILWFDGHILNNCSHMLQPFYIAGISEEGAKYGSGEE
jgi:hypothetical protein